MTDEILSKPYPGVPPSKTKDMESCVNQVMNSPKMKSKYPDHQERKSHAIAICHDSIVGGKKIDFDFEDGKEVKKKEEDMKVKKEDIKKQDEPVVEPVEEEAPVAEAPVEEKPAEEVPVVEEKPVEEKPAEEPVAEEPKEEEPAEEKPAEEVVVDAPKADVPLEVKPIEEAPVEEKPEEVESEEADVEEGEKVTKADSLLDEIVKRLDAIETLVKQAPAEGDAVVEETPKVEEVESPKEEEAPEVPVVEKAAEESTTEVAKTEPSSGDASQILDELKKISERLSVLEKQPAQSKIVVSRDFLSKGEGEDTNTRVGEIDTRLKEILEVKMQTPSKYNVDLVNEAFDLIEEKKKLKGEL